MAIRGARLGDDDPDNDFYKAGQRETDIQLRSLEHQHVVNLQWMRSQPGCHGRHVARVRPLPASAHPDAPGRSQVGAMSSGIVTGLEKVLGF